MPTDEIIITDEFNDSQGKFRNYHAYDSLLDETIRNEKHIDIRGFVSGEGWTTGVVGTLAQSNNWNGLTVTLNHGTNLIESVAEPVDLLTSFDDDSVISIALPNFPFEALELDDSYVELTSNPKGDFEAGPTAAVALEDSELLLFDGNCEFRVARSAFTDIDLSSVYGVRLRVVVESATATSQQVDLEPDTLRVHQLHLNADTDITEIRAYLDGQGSGSGDTLVKAVIYDSSNDLVATSDPLTVEDNSPPSVYIFPIAASLDAGDYYVGVIANISTDAWKRTISDTPGIVARWGMDGPDFDAARTDDVGGFDLIRNSEATMPVPGQPSIRGPGGSVLFKNSNNSRWVIPSDPVFASSSFSFEAWLRLDGNDKNFCILNLGNVTNVRGFYMWVNGTSGNLGMRCNYAGGRTDVVSPTGNGVTIGVPFHAVATYDGTTMRLYKDGVEVGNTTSLYVVPELADLFAIGYIGGGTSWEGIIDEVSFYNRVLTPAEVSDHYTGTYRAGRRVRLYGDDLATPSTNLVVNPKLGDDATGWEVSLGSGAYVDLGGSVRALLPDGSGDYGIRGYAQHDATTNNASIAANTNTPISTHGVPVKGNTQYQLSADVLIVDPPSTNGMRHLINWYDASGTNLGNNGSMSGYMSLPVGRSRISYITTSPANAAYARLYTQALTTTPNDIIDYYVTRWRFTDDLSEDGARYYDGSSPGWVWDGTADASKSRGPQGQINLAGDPRGQRSGTIWRPRNVNIDVLTSGSLESLGATVPHPDGIQTGLKDIVRPDVAANSMYVDCLSADFTPVSPGEVISASCDCLLTPGNTTTNYGVRLLFYDANKAIVTSGTNVGTICSDTAWTTVKDEGRVVPAGAAYVGMRIANSAGNVEPGQGVFFTAIRLNRGPVLLPFFDGEDDGCDWLGEQYRSPSIKWQVPSISSSYSSPPSTLSIMAGADLPYGASLTLQPVGNLTVSGLRLLPADWERPNISLNTALGRLMATPTLDGSSDDPADFNLPSVFRAAEPAGSLNDPRPIDGELAFVFDTGSMSAEQSFDIYMREVPWDLLTQIELNGMTQEELNNFHVSVNVDDHPSRRINLVTNPKAASGSTGWSQNASPTTFEAVTLGEEGAPDPSPELTDLGITTAFHIVGDQFVDGAGTQIAVVEGRTYRMSAWVYNSLASTAPVDLSDGTTNGDNFSTKGEWIRIDQVLPATTAETRTFAVRQANSGTAEFWFTGVLVEESETLNDYFDGDVGPTGKKTRWWGTPNASRSELIDQSVILADWRQPEVSDAVFRSRVQSDLQGFTQSQLQKLTQGEIERVADDTSTSYIKFGFSWSTDETAITIQDQDNRGFSTTEGALEPNKTYLYIASLRDYTARGRLYLLSTLNGMLQSELNLLTQGEIETLNRGVEVTQPALVYDTGKMVNQNVYKRRKGRIGWQANLVDGDAFVDSLRTRGLNFAEIRTRPLLSDTPVAGAQLYVPHSPSVQLFAGFSPTTKTPAIHVTRDKDRSTSGESWKVVDYGQEAKHGVISNPMVFTNFEESEVSFDLYYPSSGPGVEAYLQSAGGLRIQLVMPRIVRDQWHRYNIPTRFTNEVQTGTYRLVLIQPETSRVMWWVDNVEVVERTVAWEACANEPDPWAPLEPREYALGINVAKDPYFTQPELWTVNNSTLVNQIWKSETSGMSRSLFPKPVQQVPNYGGNYRFSIDLEVNSASSDVVVLFIWFKEDGSMVHNDGAIIIPAPTAGHYVLSEDWFFDPYELNLYEVTRLAAGLSTSDTFDIKLNEIKVQSLDPDPYVHWTPFKDTVNTSNGGILFDERGTSLRVRGRALRQNAWVGGPIRIEPKYAELGRLVGSIEVEEAPVDMRPFTGTLVPNDDTGSSGWAASEGGATVIEMITDDSTATYAYADANESALSLAFPLYSGRDVKRVVASYMANHDSGSTALLELLYDGTVLEATLQSSITYYPPVPFAETDMHKLTMRITKLSGDGSTRVREASLDWTAVGAPPG